MTDNNLVICIVKHLKNQTGSIHIYIGKHGVLCDVTSSVHVGRFRSVECSHWGLMEVLFDYYVNDDTKKFQ